MHTNYDASRQRWGQPHNDMTNAIEPRAQVFATATEDGARRVSQLASAIAPPSPETVTASILAKIEACIDIARRRSESVAETRTRLEMAADRFSGSVPTPTGEGAKRGPSDRPEPHCGLAAIHDRLTQLNLILADMPVTELADQAARFEGLA